MVEWVTSRLLTWNAPVGRRKQGCHCRLLKIKIEMFPFAGLLLFFNINSSASEEAMEGGRSSNESRVGLSLNMLPRLESSFVFCVV